MSDDHAAHAISAYGSVLNRTPNIDRIAREGARLNNCFCTNAICAPSRASILTGTYSHVNGVRRLQDNLDQRQPTVDKLLQSSGYETGLIGKWHLGHGGNYDPAGFDYWCILPDQGEYNNPEMIENGTRRRFDGYVTDILTDLSLQWLQDRSSSNPFMLMLHHKAPHRRWVPSPEYATKYEADEMPLPATFDDDYQGKATAAQAANMRILDDIVDADTKVSAPDELYGWELKYWKYQKFIKDYLRCIDSVDDSVGRIMKYLDETNQSENTIVIYTSDQGFFLGDHGWYDKRFFFEESLRMPFIVKYPREIPKSSVCDAIVLNTDFAPLLLDFSDQQMPDRMQGLSFRHLLRNEEDGDWRQDMYYRYFDYPGDCNTYAHFGIRTKRYKLICYYEPGPVEWELFDLDIDPYEMSSVYGRDEYASMVSKLESRLFELQASLGDECPVHRDDIASR